MSKNFWDKVRASNNWVGGYVDWTDGDTAYLSVVFSWRLPEAYQRVIWYKTTGYRVRVGGPAVDYNPGYFDGLGVEVGGHVAALEHHNKNAVFTTRGCIRQCSFCIVHRVEGGLVELDDWEPKPVVCDNNLLAASARHFDDVVNRYLDAGTTDIDFNQGLDARLLNAKHIQGFKKLNDAGQLKILRLAWDNVKTEESFRKSHALLIKGGIPAKKIGVYVLIGYRDTPEDALYRLSGIRDLGSLPYPMRYQPLGTLRRNSYVGKHWSNRELNRYTRYWSSSRLYHIPFAEYQRPHTDKVDSNQISFFE